MTHALFQRHALGEVENPPAGLVDEHQATLGVDDEDALVDQVHDGLESRSPPGDFPLEPPLTR